MHRLARIATYLTTQARGVGRCTRRALSDDAGRVSSYRIILVMWFGLVIYFTHQFFEAFKLEIIKPEPDYRGLSEIFLAMFGTFILGLLGKVIQKKYENDGNGNETDREYPPDEEL